MEREIQVISPGALGNAMQPGQCPPQPRRLCAKWKNFGRGNGTAAGGPSSCPGVESPQEGPQHPRGPQHPWGSPESMGTPLGHGTHGNLDAPMPSGWAQRPPSPIPSCKETSPQDPRGHCWAWHPLVAHGAEDTENLVASQWHRAPPVEAAPIADANSGIPGRRRERCKINPQRGFCVPEQGGGAGVLRASIFRLSLFFFCVCLELKGDAVGAARLSGPPHSFQGGADSGVCEAPMATTRAWGPWRGRDPTGAHPGKVLRGSAQGWGHPTVGMGVLGAFWHRSP